ncbi:hypothetical protein ACFWY9_28475 [Amycolatopsis sp. NPDC059027]|uniref:hypothetical protein n=1 Tax=Amycolatopsis sp. NPDC059027 TaxID=3346709 RepID=UPI00366E0746
MPHPTSPRAWRTLLAACLAVPALAACSGDPAPPPAPSAPSAPPSAPTSASTHAPPPLPDTGTTAPPPPPAAKPGTATPAAAPAAGSCGTVTAASGLTLDVVDSTGTSGIPCAEATKLVTEFHRKIVGRQGSGSNDAVNDTVDGWLCVSGAPAAQGGTTCSKGEQTVFASVVPSE